MIIFTSRGSTICTAYIQPSKCVIWFSELVQVPVDTLARLQRIKSEPESSVNIENNVSLP